MNKKGFTLIELLGVVVLLGLLAVLAVPTVSRIIKNSQNQAYKMQLSSIIEGLKSWATDNAITLPSDNGDSITLTLAQLKNGGYVDVELVNPKSELCFGNELILTITRLQNNYVYEIDEDSDIETEDCTINSGEPNIILNGEINEFVQLGSVYTDKGFTATTATGIDITGSAIVTIDGDYSTIDTDILNSKYRVSYSITDNGLTTVVFRNVKITDKIKPSLTIPGDITISPSITTFDFMTGVIATDNDGEIVDIKYTTNLTLKIKGEYYVKYTATDASGNTTTKTMNVYIATTCFTFNSDTKTITDYNNSCSRDVVIPDTINGIKVEHIGAASFINAEGQFCTNDDATYVDVGLAYINTGAYQACYFDFTQSDNITSLKLPKYLKTIGQSAFDSNLITELVVPEGVTLIDTAAFYGNQITKLVLPNTLSEIKWWAFEDNQISTVIIPTSAKTLGYSVFKNNQISRVSIPYGMTSIGERSFENNALTTVSIPSSVTFIDEWAFANNNIVNVAIPNGVETIGQSAFDDNLIKSINLPNTLYSIEDSAFANNDITSVTIPSSVFKIYNSAFRYNLLTSVTIKSKANSASFTNYGTNIWGWDTGYSDSNIIWNG